MTLEVQQLPKPGVSFLFVCLICHIDIAIFLGDNNDLDAEEADDDDDLIGEIDEQEEIDHDNLLMEENKEDNTVDRVTSHLRQSNNGNPAAVAQSNNNQGLEGFAGIVGVGFGGGKKINGGQVSTVGQKGGKK